MSSSTTTTSSSSSSTSGLMLDESAMNYMYLAIRLVLAFTVVWYARNSTTNQRLFSGFLSAVLSGFLTFTYLEPLFAHVGLELAQVTLWVLSSLAAGVGMSLGVLLPTLFPGACAGASLTLLVGSFWIDGSSNVSTLYFPVVGGVFSLVFALLSVRYCSKLMVTLANLVEGGAIVSCLVLKAMLPHIMNVARGYQLYPSNEDHQPYNFGLPVSTDVILGSVWTASCFLLLAAITNRDGNCNSLSVSNDVILGSFWTELSAAIRDGNCNSLSDVSSVFFRCLDARRQRQQRNGDGYQSIPVTTTDGSNKTSTSYNNRPIREPPQAAPDAYNMFDPADLPPRLAEYANMVYSACEDLGNFFGFQDSSVRNQAEHLLILLSNNRRYMNSQILPPTKQPPSPAHALHAKVFKNYVQWCRAMGVPPHFSKMNASVNAPPAVASKVVDMVLYFCVWGEASNIRHTPECVCFFYHKMMEEYVMSGGYNTQTKNLYSGHFLDHVVTPVYKVIEKGLKGKDHCDKRNYDDLNEFFWSRSCLGYHYASGGDQHSELDMEGFGGMMGPLPGESLPPVAEALAAAPKTFLEKRSWLRGVLALNRIIEWHIATFFLLGVIAFSRELVWGWVYSLQVASGVFWIINALHLIWALLEVWGRYPGIQLTGTEICGSVFLLIARFLALVYQSLYIMWAFSPQKGVYRLGIEEDSTFWWWQYVWLSLLVMIPYFVEMFLQCFPQKSRNCCVKENDYVQAFLNMLYPLSGLYVGKEVYESTGRTFVYMFFWLTLMAWKLFFSYIFEVYSMVLPSLQLTDDYLNYPNQSFFKMFLLLVMRWLPQFIVYIIDMSIWYAVWQAFAGTTVGFSEQLGNIRDFDDLRKNFGKAPEDFCKKLLSNDAGSRRGSSASFQSINTTNKAFPQQVGERVALLGHNNDNNLRHHAFFAPRLLDVRIQKWVMFSEAWNEIIDHFREEDIVSNAECDNLKFSRFDGFSQAVYLPVFQTAGVVDSVMSELERPTDDTVDSKTGLVTDEDLFKTIDDTMKTAVCEAWELGCFLFMQVLGPKHSEDVNAIVRTISHWSDSSDLTTHMKVQDIRLLMKHVGDVVNTLQKGIGKRKPATRPRLVARQNTASGGVGGVGVGGSTGSRRQSYDPKQLLSLASHSASMSSRNIFGDANNNNNRSLGMRKAMSSGSLSGMGGMFDVSQPVLPSKHTEKIESIDKPTLKPQEGTGKKGNEIDALRDQLRDNLRNVTHIMKKKILKNTELRDAVGRDILDRLTFLASMENGFFWDDDYASDQLDLACKNETFKAVLKKLHGLVCMHPDDAEPKHKEVKRRLTFFTNSLGMEMPEAPSIHDMFSWNVLTPFYSEDVTYSKAELVKRSDALGVSTLLYLQTLYRSDWNNFLERLGIDDEEKVWSKKYIDKTRQWASIRAQTLSRTVNGMMYCEKALRLLANMERLDENTTNDLMGEKFGYIVTCQIYGKMKRNQDPKADDIDDLMHKFPHLRIAYIDTIRLNRSGDSCFYSVLVKSDGNGGIQEIYRVKLPGNPILGEGKPENQNHAMIFSRGEFVQTIDMNQEGYFEEALKMRNALQEFAKREGPLPTTILGLREHIFTGSVSSLANYMAMQEISFVTLGQRVLNKPLRIRLHYGHPDVFDKLFFITRGGISKSSKGINLSEDIFAGYNNVLRGGAVGFKEYLQVGKGRDVGMSQIYKFEAKLSQGAAEQSLSRDVYRMCNRLDFTRLLSYYYGGIGHYFSNVLTVLTVYVVVYLMALLAIYDLEKIGDRMITPMGTIQMILGGLGLLQTIPLFATLGVERGWWASLQEIFMLFVTGGPFHFMFHIQTKANYMSQTILVGGARYRATGRGFVTQHTPYAEQFRFFASSHIYMGIELAAGLILMGIYSCAKQYWGRTWSLWLAAGSFLVSPFWFNPLAFDWNIVVKDYLMWIRWMRGSTGGNAKSWSMWWNEENAFYKTMPISSKCVFLVKVPLYLLCTEGIRRSDIFKSDITLHTPIIGVTYLMIIIALLVLLRAFFAYHETVFPYPVRRTVAILIFIGIVVSVVMLFVEDTNYIRYSLSAYYFVGAFCMLGLLFGSGIKPVKETVKSLYFIHDLVIGHIIFVPLFIAAALQLPHHIQTWLLYHNALSTDVVVGNILRYARKTQESGSGSGDGQANEDLMEQVTELRKIVQRQEQLLSNAGLTANNRVGSGYFSSGGSGGGVDAILSSGSSGSGGIGGGSAAAVGMGGVVAVNNNTDTAVNRAPVQNSLPAQRSLSLSGIDVWGDMALGDTDKLSSTTTAGAATTDNTPPIQNIVQPLNAQGFSFTQPDTMPPR